MRANQPNTSKNNSAGNKMKKLLNEWRQFLKEVDFEASELAAQIREENFKLLEKIGQALEPLYLDWVVEGIESDVFLSSEDGREEMIEKINQELQNAGETKTTVESLLKMNTDQILNLTKADIENL